MADYKTLRVPEDAWEEAKAQKEEHNRTWGEQLLCSNDSTSEANTVEEPVVDTEEIARDFEAVLERISGIEDVVGANNVQREELREDIKNLEGRIDDLENELPRKVKEELR